jgi:uncharacterized protein (UPF0332 family)
MSEVEALLQKAKESLDAARSLLRDGYPDFSASRAYYAMFYVAEALLAVLGQSYRKHSAVIAAFGREYARQGRLDPKFHQWLLAAQNYPQPRRLRHRSTRLERRRRNGLHVGPGIHRSHRGLSFEEGRGSAVKELKPWYAVATPHEDIREGRLAEAVFAANLWAVVQGTAPEVYLDPEEFFRKTYLTTGLSTALSRVASALRRGGESGDRIISLQTAFGGGKTHTLVALWHLAKHADRLKGSPHAEGLRKAVGGRLPEKVKGVAVFTNQTCDATQGRKVEDDVHLRTLWGELAYQLGGKALYERVRANDESQRVPQGLFFEILQAASPCLILLDELADYCVGAAAVPVGDTNLADQTVSFMQQLTEAVQQVPGAVVVATLPASKYEVAQSEKGQEAFVTLEKRFQRLGADVKPVADEEIYEVVRARLFESIAPESDPDYPKKVAQVYQAMYAAHAGEVPSEATKSTYHELLERAYPFHPLLIDALYTRWGSHPDFQRTRGVLRLLASIVGDLWKRRQGNTETQHLIQPCHIRWSVDALQAALTRLWGPAYQSVAAADVIGSRSNAGLFDEERGGDYRSESIGQGLASAILLGSFGGQGGRSGFSSKDLKLACSRYGLNWNYTDGALLELENRCFYLHTATAGSLGKRYWFGTKPTLNKLVVQYRQQTAKGNLRRRDPRGPSGRVPKGPAGWCDLARDRESHRGPAGAEVAHPAGPSTVARPACRDGRGEGRRERRGERPACAAKRSPAAGRRDPAAREGDQHPVRRKGPPVPQHASVPGGNLVGGSSNCGRLTGSGRLWRASVRTTGINSTKSSAKTSRSAWTRRARPPWRRWAHPTRLPFGCAPCLPAGRGKKWSPACSRMRVGRSKNTSATCGPRSSRTRSGFFGAWAR